MTGCGNFQLVRLAPPGILKYEEIASQKPPNPAIEAEIAARNGNAKARFPILAQTPAAGPAPKPASKAAARAHGAALQSARDSIDRELARHRAAEQAERGGREKLAKERASLAEQINRDEIVARRERAAPMPRLKQTPQQQED